MVAYSNHSEGSTTKLFLHINNGITPTSLCPVQYLQMSKVFKPHPSTKNLKNQLRRQLKWMVTNIIISGTLLLMLVLFPLLLFISSNFLLKLLQKRNQILEYKTKEKEKQTKKKKIQFNLVHLLLRFHKSILSTTQILILIKIFLAKHLSPRRNFTQ